LSDEALTEPEVAKLKDRLVGLFRLQVMIALAQLLLTTAEWREVIETTMIHGAARAQDLFVLFPPLIIGGSVAIAGAVVGAKARATARRSPKLRYSTLFRLLTAFIMVQPPAACVTGMHVLGVVPLSVES